MSGRAKGGTEPRLADTRAVEEMVLTGVKCPLNWARAKVRLEEMPRGARISLLVDDPRAVRDIPRAAEAHGYCVVEVAAEGDAWRIEIER
ncbi:MAG TPA: sulfurtransferase TusA family protein [Candidatus Binatia bacterium]|nr:sulfurtransferase TusA family protein [Candidatus Binatia bacterium]